ncbi:PDZ domain-containing protein [Paenibacillus sabuli]|nr:PDZ domain-containing protein [Paenibacillus sabuli]
MAELGRQAVEALLQLLLQPLSYVAVLVLALYYMRQTRIERRLFQMKLQAWPLLLLRLLGGGLAVGLLVSCAAVLLGIRITPDTLYWVWGAGLLLSLIRVRFLCIVYAAGLVGLLQWIAGWLAWETWPSPLEGVAASLARVEPGSLLLLAAVLHLGEAILLRVQGERLSSPRLLAGKRGKLIGAYRLQGLWPVPLLLLTPALEAGAGAALPWTPLLGGAESAGGWLLLGLPAVIGYGSWTRAQLPGQLARRAARGALLYSVLLGGLAAAALWWAPLTALAALAAPLLHEALARRGRRGEDARLRYMHDERGLCVLGVVPGTPAAQLGITAGERLHKVNGIRVRTRQELYEALHANSAFCKLEVLNHEQELKFLQRARFDGEPHQLGIILAPDERDERYALERGASLLDLVARRRATRHRSDEAAL